MNTTFRNFTLAAAITATAPLSACAAPAAGTDTSCRAPSALVIIVPVHANATTGLPQEAACVITKAMDNHAPISVIAEDGSPRAVQTRAVYDVTPGSPTYAQDSSKALAELINTIASAKATSDGINPLGALSAAADLLEGQTAPVIVSTSTGNSDVPPLDLTEPSLSAADPAEVLAQLKARKALPSLAGVELIWSGINRDAGTQKPLAQSQKETFKKIWAVTAEAAGAQVRFVPAPSSGAPAKHSGAHRVKPVEPLASTPVVFAPAGGTFVYTNASALGFAPDSTTLRDPAAAAATAQDLAAWLKADPRRAITITGTTASAGDDAGRAALSTARADAVADLVAKEGIARDRITTTGAGINFDGFVPDRDANGTLDPVKAELNRGVRVTLTP
jgi:outer membrane protein OmpA-like peptidoglycan-associated protein